MKSKTTLLKAVFIFTALFTMPLTQAQTLVAHYEFNNAVSSSGGTYTDDLTAREATGTKGSDASSVSTTFADFSYVADKDSNAASALRIGLVSSGANSGTNRNFLQGTNNLPASVLGSNSRTYCIWFKVPPVDPGVTGSDTNGGNGGLIDAGVRSHGERFSVLVNSSREINVGVNGWGMTTSTGPAVNDDTWTFAVANYDSVNNETNLYLTEGSDITTVTLNGTPSRTVNTQATPLRIGATAGNLIRAFIGDIADVRVYSGLLTLSQMNQVKNGAVLGVPDVAFAKNELEAFPTVVKDYLTIESTVTGRPQVTLYNLTGKAVKTEFSKKIDMSNLASGLYIVNVRIGKKVGSLKVVKD